MKTNILLTGATGFIGSFLAEELVNQGFKVKALVRNPDKLRWPINNIGKNLELIKGDITRSNNLEEACKDVNVIIHVAGLTKALKFEDYYLANAKSCELLINARDKKKFKQFIFFSSIAAGGPAINNTPRKESDKEAPISNYGLTKLKGEEVIKSLNVTYTIFRPVPVYGERDMEFYPLFKSVLKGWKPTLAGGKKTTGMIYYKDLIKGIILAIDNKKAFNQTYNISDGNLYTWNDVNDTAEQVTGKKCRKLLLPMFTATMLGNINSIIEKIIKKPLLLNKEKLKEMKQDSWDVDISKIKNELGYKPDYTLEQGFTNAFNWYVENEWLKVKNK